MEWLTWAVLLILQQASHTASSRAKNSKSLWYSGGTAVFSNGIWYGSQFFIVKNLVSALDDPAQLFISIFFYITLTTAGTVSAHWYLLRFERKRGL